jgi:hypothetical protein
MSFAACNDLMRAGNKPVQPVVRVRHTGKHYVWIDVPPAGAPRRT